MNFLITKLGKKDISAHNRKKINAINNQYVFVVESEDQIEGYLHFNILESKKDAYVYGLYLSKKIKGLGFGKKLIDLMFEILKKENIRIITLNSTLTAHKFYKKVGFSDSGPIESVNINNTPIRSIPMFMYICFG